MSPSAQEHYAALFADLEESSGAAHGPTLTGIVGFSAGGPVSMRRIGNSYVTCELSMYAEQVASSEGLKFELLSSLELEEQDSHRLLTALGALSMSNALGDSHVIDVSQVLPEASFTSVQLQLLSQCEISGQAYGIYSVVPAGA